LRIGLLDHDDAFAFNDRRFHLLLLIGFQIARVLGLLAHALYGIHHISLLRQKGITKIGSPLNVIREAIDNIG
jgi:hypothetical protein